MANNIDPLQIMQLVVAVIVIYCVINIMNGMSLGDSYGGGDNNMLSKIKHLDIIFLKMPSCSHCIKMEALLLSENLLNHVNVMDITTNKHAQHLIKKHNVRGFPTFISNKTGKTTAGYTENIENLINNLQS